MNVKIFNLGGDKNAFFKQDVKKILFCILNYCGKMRFRINEKKIPLHLNSSILEKYKIKKKRPQTNEEGLYEEKKSKE